MTTMKMKESPPADETQGQEAVEKSAPEKTSPARDPEDRAFSELLSKGAEEIQDHLSLVAQIQVKIRHLLETSIEELERAQRLETLTSLIAGSGFDGDKSGPEDDSVGQSPTDRPGAYLEHEISVLKKMQRLLGVRARPDEEAGPQAADVAQALAADVEAEEAEGHRKILIIFHDPGMLRVLRYFLEKESFEVLTSANGPDGLQKAAREKPDIILLDILLSGMDGYQVLGRLKKNEKTARIPVFVLSVLAQEADILKAIEAGAADYFTKPFSPLIIIAKIRRALGARRE